MRREEGIIGSSLWGIIRIVKRAQLIATVGEAREA